MTVKITESEKTSGQVPAFEVCRRAADSYLNGGKALNITAQDLFNNIIEGTFLSKRELQNYDPERFTGGPVLVDLRSPDSEMHELYYCGHLPGAIHIPWRQITQPKYLGSLPKDRKIIVYSNSGQTGGQVAAILNILGYDAINLKWGMTSWTKDPDAAPERFEKKRDVLWQGDGYRSTVNCSLEEEETYSLPEVHYQGRIPQAVLWSAADKYLMEFKPANISASALYDPIFAFTPPLALSPYEEDNKDPMVLPFGVKPGESDEAYEWPFILDIRDDEAFGSGHIPASLHIYWKDLFKTENLKKLPPDRRIVACSGTGHTAAHVTALLNISGYDAINLRWGMSGWSRETADGDRYYDDKDCMDYPIVKGWSPGRALLCKS